MIQRGGVRSSYRLFILSLVGLFVCGAGRASGQGAPAAAAAASTRPAMPEKNQPSPVSGTVVDDRTGQPIGSFTVTYGDDRSIPYWQHRDGRSFIDGRFTFAPPAPPYFDGKEYRLQVLAAGYKAAASRLIRRTESGVRLEFRLVRPERFAGVAGGPDGKPVARAVVRVVTPGNYFLVTGGAPSTNEPAPPGDERRVTKTDDGGRFDVDVDCDRCRVVVLHESGFADLVTTRAARAAGAVSLRPWGSIACDVVLAGRPAAGVSLSARTRELAEGDVAEAHVDFDVMGTTDARGRCVLSRMFPGKAVVGLYEPFEPGKRDTYWGSRIVREVPLEVPAGGEAAVRIGGGGAEVIGRFTAPGREIPWKYAIARLYPGFPEGAPAPRPADWRDEVLMRRMIPVEVRPDGTFRATDVPPGDWRIDAKIYVERPDTERLLRAGEVPKRFHVRAAAAAERNDTARAAVVELGDLPVSFWKRLEAGKPAPDFEIVTLDGNRLRLSDLRGKYVVLDFWATWCGPCKADLPFLKESWQAVKNDRDVVILGLSLDATDAPVRGFVAEHGYGWTHAVLGEESKIATDYGVVYIPQVWLVLPDGTLATASVDGLAEQIARHRQKAAAPKAP